MRNMLIMIFLRNILEQFDLIWFEQKIITPKKKVIIDVTEGIINKNVFVPTHILLMDLCQCVIASSFLDQRVTKNEVPLKLHYTLISNIEKKPPVASVVIIHGLGQYSELYYEFAQHFAAFHYESHLIDLRGFGYSGGVKGLSNFEDMINDIELLLQQVRRDIPLFLCGHSLGASLLLSIGERNPNLKISGFIALAPLLDPNRHGYERSTGVFSKITQFGVRFLGEFLGVQIYFNSN